MERAEAQIGELSAGLDDVDKEVAVLREKLNRSTKEATEVEFHLNKAQETITAAESLVTKLEGEYQRWSQQVRVHFYICTHHSITLYSSKQHGHHFVLGEPEEQ